MDDPAPYDPNARRDTPLALKLKARIRRDGAIPVDQYMRACLYDREHGYYVRRPAIGASGDFITAPEISQVFGELLGLWAAVTWQQMGAPRPFDLVEYGPGRGTLMADVLRALAKVPACLAAARVRLVEVSPTLREQQRERLAGAPVEITWHGQLHGEVAPVPSVVLANEVLDAEVVEQLAGLDSGVAGVRSVTVDSSDRLQFCTSIVGGGIEPDRFDITEIRELHPLVSRDLERLPSVAALLIDYGHTDTEQDPQSALRDTLQAVRGHRYEHPLTSPGEADLTAQVDFAEMALQCENVGFAVDGPVTQAAFLSALGIAERASRLMAANAPKAHEIETGVARLMSPTGMGARFKAIGLRSPHLPKLPGFP